MITKERVDKAWQEWNDYKERHFGGPGNGCDDYRDIPDEVFRKKRELEDKARKLQKEYDESLKSYKAIIKKNDNGTYKIIDLNGNDYIVHYKIGKTEYKNEFIKNLSWADIQDIISMYHIEFVNYNEIEEENKYVPNDVFQFRLNLKKDLGEFEIPIYVQPFPDPWDKDYDESKYISPEDQEQIVQDKYFTQRKIDELKLKLIQRIQECKNPFDIFCYDTDGGYNVTADQLFNLD